MTKSWKKAQENEKLFWENIYVDNKSDISTYKKITKDESIKFSKKTVERHSLDCKNELNGKKILDVGCGPYGILKGLAHISEEEKNIEFKLVGVDPLMNFYKSLKNYPEVAYLELYESQGEKLPFESSSMDYVFSTNVIDHVENPEKVILEISRVIKDDGIFCPSVHVVRPYLKLFAPLIKYFDKNHPHHFTEESFSAILSKGFKSIKVVNRITMFQDHPEFRLRHITKSPNLIRGLKRYLSNWVLYSVYFNCSKDE